MRDSVDDRLAGAVGLLKRVRGSLGDRVLRGLVADPCCGTQPGRLRLDQQYQVVKHDDPVDALLLRLALAVVGDLGVDQGVGQRPSWRPT